MKFILVLQICSAVLNTCQNSQKANVTFDDYKLCGVSGYSIAGSIIEEMDQVKVNAEEIYIRFTCMKNENEDA